MDNHLNNTAIVPSNFYMPSELLNIFANFLSNREINATVVTLQGIYLGGGYIYGQVAYDHLRDEHTADEITIVLPLSIREELKNGNLITVSGTIGRRLQKGGNIQIQINVSRINKLKDIVVDEAEMKRAEFRRVKEQRGFKNVDWILENILFTNTRRPKVALLFAGTSITQADFIKGVQAARASIDFIEFRANFADSMALCTILRRLDDEQFDVIALVRGGGSGIEKLDELPVVETLTHLQTPWIHGVGHEKEELFVQNIADKVIKIPHAVGTYFRDMVESVAERRNNSRAAMMQEVKGQYIQQIKDAQKVNEELQKTLNNQKNQITELNKQIETNNKGMQDINKNLTNMQLTNNRLNASLNQLTAKNAKAEADLREAKNQARLLEQQIAELKRKLNSGCFGLIITFITLIGAACFSLLLMVGCTTSIPIDTIEEEQTDTRSNEQTDSITVNDEEKGIDGWKEGEGGDITLFGKEQ